jgi:hypothetical protein
MMLSCEKVSKAVKIVKNNELNNNNEFEHIFKYNYGYSSPNIPLGSTPPYKEHNLKNLIQNKVYENYLKKTLDA